MYMNLALDAMTK